MYLARKQINGKTHYCIRESYKDGDLIKSRDLFDLGTRPDEYIIYPGGNACYFHEDIYDQLSEKGIEPDDDELETIFWPFLRYETQRGILGTVYSILSSWKNAASYRAIILPKRQYCKIFILCTLSISPISILYLSDIQ
ncbi:MAG: hypothetical protein PF482_12305, partial [Desulfobacteraceae bacterium]|nr:hypothetical protein [Desulfobacteraceae bacterium]